MSLHAQRIYLDYAATTPVHPEVEAAMRPFFAERYGNASSVHRFGREARVALDKARQQVARFIAAHIDEIVFTGCGTEADNLALIGVALRHRERGAHLVTTQIEHHAVLRTCKFLERLGYEVTYVPVDGQCRVDPAEVARALRDDTILVSVMLANNEVGTIEPVTEIARVARERGIAMHTDAIQAIGSSPVNVNTLGVDLLSLSAHKIYGPKGAGALYIRRGVSMVPWLHGGEQERGRRGGTENVPACVGLGAACEIAASELPAASTRIASLRDELEQSILAAVEGAQVNGHPVERLPGHLNVSLGVSAESISMNLDLAGFAVSTGSACTSGATAPSHVLSAMGLAPERVASAIRLTLGRQTTREEITTAARTIAEIAARLRKPGRRAMSMAAS